MHLRAAKTSDLELTYRIKSKSIKPYVEKIWGWNEPNQRKIHNQSFNANDTKLIEYHKQYIGFLVIKETDNEIYIENLLIAMEFQNLGIGKTIMEQIVKSADFKKKRIRLKVFKINTKAQRFYENFGLEKISEMENHIEMEKTSQNTT